MTGMAAQKSTTIHVVLEHETAEQIKDEIRSNHPLLAAIADQIQTMDERETLRYILGVEIVADLLKLHAFDLVVNQTAIVFIVSNQNIPIYYMWLKTYHS